MTGTADPDRGGPAASPGPGAARAAPHADSTDPETGSAPPGADEAAPEAGSAAPRPGEAAPGAAGGTEPDARFTFANERTFLAWSRTGLALIVAGLGIVQLLPPFPHVPWGRHLIGIPLIVLGAVVAIAGYGDWIRNQRALRRREPVPRSALPVVLTMTIAAIAIVSAIVLLVSAIR
jgi:putative membrane protein